VAFVDVTLTVQLPGFTPSAARAFVGDAKRLESVRFKAQLALEKSSDWEYQNVRLDGAEIRLNEGEVERYDVEEYGTRQWVVVDRESGIRYAAGRIVAGPWHDKIITQKVRDTLQAHEDLFTGLDAPDEDRGGDSGDYHDLPF
jgi:hypothetical protein